MSETTDRAPKLEHPGIVVLVDDEPTILRAMRRMLEPCRYSVATCRTPYEAIDHIIHGNVVVVVSDIVMPEMSGIELLRTIRQFDSELPVVLVTGMPSLSAAAEAVEYGAFSYLMKPFDSDVFRHTVEHAARLYRLVEAKREAAGLFAPESETPYTHTTSKRVSNDHWPRCGSHFSRSCAYQITRSSGTRRFSEVMSHQCRHLNLFCARLNSWGRSRVWDEEYARVPQFPRRKQTTTGHSS